MNFALTNHIIARANTATSYVPCSCRVRWSLVKSLNYKGTNQADKQEENF
jgi:hypothetical protein